MRRTMMTAVRVSMFLCAVLVTAAVPAFAAEHTAGHDDFGGSYFTGQSPSALSDGPAAALAAAGDMDAEAVSRIEPAAGGDDVFTLPDDPAAAQGGTGAAPVLTKDGKNLAVPTKPLVPGMTVPDRKN